MKMRAFFSHIACLRGDENPRPGFDNWRQPVGQTESITPESAPSNGMRSESISILRQIQHEGSY
jgi:hypothetical protein